MKRLVLFPVLLGLAFAAGAQSPTPAVPADPAAPVADAASAPGKTAKEEASDRNCLRETGSRLIRRDSKGRKCAIAAGRSYDRKDIDRTGAVGLRDALRKLDPAVH